MKIIMYVVMLLLAGSVVILTVMRDNKPPAVPKAEQGVAAAETAGPRRGALFSTHPRPVSDEPADGDADGTATGGEEGTGEAAEEKAEEEDYGIVLLDRTMYAISAVNVRAGPNTDFDRIGSLLANQEVRVVGQSMVTSWYMIEYRDRNGFVSNKYLTVDAPSAPSDDDGGGDGDGDGDGD